MKQTKLITLKCSDDTRIVTDGIIAAVIYTRDEHEWCFAATLERRQELLRTLGQHASDLLDPFNWQDALYVRDAIRDYWPEVCNCHACQQREKLAQVQETFEKVKLSPIEKFFQWLYGVKHG